MHAKYLLVVFDGFEPFSIKYKYVIVGVWFKYCIFGLNTGLNFGLNTAYAQMTTFFQSYSVLLKVMTY